MKRVLTILMGMTIGFFPVVLWAGIPNSLTSEEVLLTNWNRFERHLEQMERKQRRFPNHEAWLVESVFHSSHFKFLRQYEAQASMEDLVQEGQYDCVTGSWLLGMVYESLGFKVSVRELNFHVYLVLEGAQDSYLVEATDPASGITQGKEAIGRLEEWLQYEDYQQWLQVQQDPNSAFFLVQSSVNETRPFSSIVGLYYYNQAIVAWQGGAAASASAHLQDSMQYLDSDRSKTFLRMAFESPDFLPQTESPSRQFGLAIFDWGSK